MKTFRIIALVLIGLAAIVVAFLPTTRSTGHAAEVSAALASAELNNSNAQGAPQQTVVNGWVARDLLATISAQLDEQNTASDRKVPLLLMLGVLALVVIGCTTPGQAPQSPGLASTGATVPPAGWQPPPTTSPVSTDQGQAPPTP